MCCDVKNIGKHCVRGPALSFFQKAVISERVHVQLSIQSQAMPSSRGHTCWDVVICTLQVRSGQIKSGSGASAINFGCTPVSMERMLLSGSQDHKFIAWSPWRFAVQSAGFFPSYKSTALWNKSCLLASPSWGAPWMGRFHHRFGTLLAGCLLKPFHMCILFSLRQHLYHKHKATVCKRRMKF